MKVYRDFIYGFVPHKDYASGTLDWDSAYEVFSEYRVYEPGDREYVLPNIPCPHGELSQDVYKFHEAYEQTR